jgi:hypothetical protein
MKLKEQELKAKILAKAVSFDITTKLFRIVLNPSFAPDKGKKLKYSLIRMKLSGT